MEYGDFLLSKVSSDPATGLSELPGLPDSLFDFQSDITRWALRRGRAAIFAGTGLGKSLMELSWASAIHEATGRDVLILAPLAVASQVVREGEKFGIRAKQCARQDEVEPGITVTNYQKLDHFDAAQFVGVVLDESSILKALDGKTKMRLIETFRETPFRLAATATPAPNDFMELGNHAEFLGVMKHSEMLSTFFVHDGGETQKWRLKGHAEDDFWRWMGSWSVMLRDPSDLGYDASAFDLPPLNQHQHTVETRNEAPDGMLFAMEAQTLQERLAARRSSVEERVERAAEVICGDLSDKLAETKPEMRECGSQSTQRAEREKPSQTPSTGQKETPKEGERTPKGGPNTCASTSVETPTSGSEAESSRTKSTHGEGSGTPKTRNSEKPARHHQGSGTKNPSGTRGCGANSGSPRQNTTKCFDSKAGVAQSAVSPNTMGTDGGCTSIIVTKPEGSEGSFARTATPGSENSKTTPTISTGPSNTCLSRGNDPWLVWCQLNSEQDALEKAFRGRCISVRGSMSDQDKEESLLAWLRGEKPILISKPSICGFGLNFQHCANMMFVGLNDSFEQVYQAIRRCWRFGQTLPVNVHFVASDMEGAVVDNLRRKEQQAERMAENMVEHMADITADNLRGTARRTDEYEPQQTMELPSWIKGEAA